MDIGKGGASLAIQPGGAAVGFGAGLLAVIAAHAQRFVDQQHIGGFTQTLAYQEGDQVSPGGSSLHGDVLCGALLDLHGQLAAQCRILHQ